MYISTEKYHFDVPGEAIWISHIIMGLFFVYVGYSILLFKRLPQYISVSVIVLGVLAILYHVHIWYYALNHQKIKPSKH